MKQTPQQKTRAKMMAKLKVLIDRLTRGQVDRVVSCASDHEVNVWRTAPDGEYGAWQYQKGNCQGGEGTLRDALYQASFLGKRIRIHDTPQAGISERS